MSQYDDLYEIEEKPKRKRNEDPTTWADAWKAIGIFVAVYFAVAAFSWSIQYLVHGELTERYFDISLNSAGIGEMGILSGYMEALQSPNPLFLALYLLVTALFVAIVLFVIYGLIHIFATKVQGGDGTLRGLIVRANGWTTGVLIVYTPIATAFNYFLMSSIVNRYEGVNIARSATTLNEYNQFVLTQSSLLYVAMFLAWLVWSIGVGFTTAKNYQTSQAKGCLSVFLTNITLIAMYCGCAFAVGFAFASMIMGV